MKHGIKNHLEEVLGHLYINPLERCNLRCEICYTRKTSPILPKENIDEFITRYITVHSLETVTFCGGEVFTLPYFTALVNELTEQGIFVQMITNGTIDRLVEFSSPNSVNLIVSIDGLEDYHDKNRGQGNFTKSLLFMKKALSLGFHVEVFSIVTKQNFSYMDALENYFEKFLGQKISVTYHPRKPPSYLLHHPVSNIFGTVNGFDFLSNQEMIQILKEKKTFPPKELGCYQIAVMSDGRVFGCCEGVTPIGTMNDSPETLIKNLTNRLLQWEQSKQLEHCLGCSQPDFVCGIKQYLTILES